MCPAHNTSTIAMQASLWFAGNQPLQFSLILNWPKPLLLFSFQFSLHWVIYSRCQNCPLSHPSTSIFRGFSVLMAFVRPEDRKLKFKTLRELILFQKSVDLKTLQGFTGKTTSFSIAVPAARLYTCASFHAILSGSKSPHKPLFVAADLLCEIQYWRFLDNWQGCLPWFD